MIFDDAIPVESAAVLQKSKEKGFKGYSREAGLVDG